MSFINDIWQNHLYKENLRERNAYLITNENTGCSVLRDNFSISKMKYTFILTIQCSAIAQLINYICLTSYLKICFNIQEGNKTFQWRFKIMNNSLYFKPKPCNERTYFEQYKPIKCQICNCKSYAIYLKLRFIPQFKMLLPFINGKQYLKAKGIAKRKWHVQKNHK